MICIEHPEWVNSIVDWDTTYVTDEDKMRLAIRLSRENIDRGTGGPFGAAIYEASGRLVSIGVNSVVRYNNCTLHGEMIAFMTAQQTLSTFSLKAPGLPSHELFTSCEPCAMCLGATPWSGVRRLVCAARDADARAVGFDEGSKMQDWIPKLEERGIAVACDVLREEAVAVLREYAQTGGEIYNSRGGASSERNP